MLWFQLFFLHSHACLADTFEFIIKYTDTIKKYYDADALLRQDFLLGRSVLKFLTLMGKLPFEVQLQAFCEYRFTSAIQPEPLANVVDNTAVPMGKLETVSSEYKSLYVYTE